MGDRSAQVTQILESLGAGDAQAAEQLLPLVYEELRQLASVKMAQQPPGQTLQATDLVHEAWLRMTNGQSLRWESRKHFFAAAAQAMRHILIERARRRLRLRHGGEWVRVDLDAVEVPAPADDERLLLISTALDELTALAPEKAEVVKLRFFVGLNEREIAALLHITPRTVERYWCYAKAWLFEHTKRSVAQ